MKEKEEEYSGIFDLKVDDVKGIKAASKNGKQDDMEMTDDFKEAWEAIENSGDPAIILGEAGSGKSTFIRYVMRNTSKRTVLLAPTGVAAVNIGGQTVHSFFSFPPRPLTHNNIKLVPEYDLIKYEKVETIIIDEASMVRVDMLDGIDHFLRTNLSSDAPFAGKQVILVGDLSQLPPVVGTDAEKEMMQAQWGSEYFFSADVLQKVGYRKIYFSKIFRQKDPAFLNMLNKMRNAELTQSDVDDINAKCYKGGRADYSQKVTICAVNASADQINDMELSKLPGDRVQLVGSVVGSFVPKNCPADEIITVKRGCRVMMLTNNQERKWINGTIGTLTDVDLEAAEPFVKVRIGDSEHTVLRHEFETVRFKYDAKEKKMGTDKSGSFSQFPIRLAWANTIHKSQGHTYDEVNIEFGRGAFAHGMAYVAFSRCRTLKGITLLTRINVNDFIYDKRIRHYVDSFDRRL